MNFDRSTGLRAARRVPPPDWLAAAACWPPAAAAPAVRALRAERAVRLRRRDQRAHRRAGRQRPQVQRQRPSTTDGNARLRLQPDLGAVAWRQLVRLRVRGVQPGNGADAEGDHAGRGRRQGRRPGARRSTRRLAVDGGFGDKDLVTVLVGANDVLELYAALPGRSPRTQLTGRRAATAASAWRGQVNRWSTWAPRSSSRRCPTWA